MNVRRWLLVAAILLNGGSSVLAGQARIIGDPSRDVRQTMQARKLLADDPELASWNIGVIVTNRVAVLWGPVPCAEVLFRAELCLKTMIELAEVRNELFVSELVEPTRPPLKIDNPPRYVPELLPPRLPEESRSNHGAPGVLTGQDRKAAASQTTSAAKKPFTEIKVLPHAPAPKQENIDPSGDGQLTASIQTLLQSKSTYSAVQFTVKDGRVFLHAANQDSDVLLEAARAIARLPNVGGVILTENKQPR